MILLTSSHPSPICDCRSGPLLTVRFLVYWLLWYRHPSRFFHIFDDAAVLNDTFCRRSCRNIPFVRRTGFVCEFPEFLKQFPSSRVFAPHVGITGQHAIEWNDAAPAIFIAHFNLHPLFFHFAGFQDPIAEFSLIGACQFIDIGQHHIMADDIMTEVMYVLQCRRCRRYHCWWSYCYTTPPPCAGCGIPGNKVASCRSWLVRKNFNFSPGRG